MNDHVKHLSWLAIARVGLIQTALGAVVVLTTSTLNRVMVVELMLPAMLPGVLIGLHHAIQLLRPRFGYGSDVGGRRTPWIIGGMFVLALGGFLAAVATAVMASNTWLGIALAFFAFTLVGGGVGAAGTSLLVLLAKAVAPARRAAAATVVWTMMIAGFVVTTIVAGQFLDPFSFGRLMTISGIVSVIAVLVAVLAVWGVEPRHLQQLDGDTDGAEKPPFMQALREVWNEQQARRFTIFVFVSMLAYNSQDLILEPFAGLVFDFSPGQSTQLSGMHHGGVMLGMILVAIACRSRSGLKRWTVGGCIASAAVLLVMAGASFVGPGWPLGETAFLLGLANGAFAVAAIGSMMGMAGDGKARREGVRMGLWGAAQAVAFGLGSFLGTVAVDVSRLLLGSPVSAYSIVFALEGLTFLVAAALALTIRAPRQQGERVSTFENIEAGAQLT